MKASWYKRVQTLIKLESTHFVRDFILHAGLDPELLGKEIAKGGQHRIFAYGVDEVIKIPGIDLVHVLFGIATYESIHDELEIAREYFAEFVPKTEVYHAGDFGLYVIRQKRITVFDYLTTRRLPFVYDLFLELVEKNNRMIQKTGMSLDWLGRDGLVGSFLKSIQKRKFFVLVHNIALLKGKKKRDYQMCIPDLNLIPVKFTRKKGVFYIRYLILHWIYSRVLLEIQKKYSQVNR